MLDTLAKHFQRVGGLSVLPGADHQGGVRVIDGQQEAVLAAQARQALQVCPVAVHAEQAVRDQQLALACSPCHAICFLHLLAHRMMRISHVHNSRKGCCA